MTRLSGGNRRGTASVLFVSHVVSVARSVACSTFWRCWIVPEEGEMTASLAANGGSRRDLSPTVTFEASEFFASPHPFVGPGRGGSSSIRPQRGKGARSELPGRGRRMLVG